MRKVVFFFLIILLSILSFNEVLAINDPTSVENNIYGIHVADPVDIQNAKFLVNSTGGDWGYVTLVIREDERDLDRWQEIFDELRRKHLIPIVRLATRQDSTGWEKFHNNDVDDWVYFLNSLNWVIENRYVIIGNEPNHAKEWGGELNPQEYTDVLKAFSASLKDASEDFYILQAGFDASAPDSKMTTSEEKYLLSMHEHDNEIFSYIDGWVSHSYPNPEFSGSEYAYGKGSIRTYEWELSFLRSLGVTKQLPVFITETGWIHDKNEDDVLYFEPQEISSKYDHAFKEVWAKNTNIVAVTPFLLKYNEPPFDSFSWIDRNSNKYPFYESVQKHQKVKGSPIQKVDGEILFSLTPNVIKKGDGFQGMILVKNTGESIWGEGNYQVEIKGAEKDFGSKNIISYLEPGETTLIPVEVDGKIYEDFEGVIRLKFNNNRFGNTYTIDVTVTEKTTLRLLLNNLINKLVLLLDKSEN